jgi:serine/threonine protein kinase
MRLAPGDQFAAYRIVAELGQGGMATVYKAFQPSLDRHVAIKVLPEFFADQPGFRQRFKQEAMAIARLRHPNIPVVFDYGEEGGLAYIVSEYLSGGSLADKITEVPMSVGETVNWLRPIAAAIDYAHSQGILIVT